MKAVGRWLWGLPFSAKVGVLAALLLVVFAFYNDSTTTIHLLFGQVDMPVYVALGVAGLLGFASGILLGHWMARREERVAGEGRGTVRDERKGPGVD